ncbi:hypothetical protein PsorP6_012463 [Peronosclerospora sorghi]|uniref:Uncharacterized protein n=1 Tax=Peronosclerospora sorghi TaxID=230839 RepID=A0ACC0WIP4_9STRA|nr:hypothetical protein PsorP6_012463 [Peronosclerospora sorghi]
MIEEKALDFEVAFKNEPHQVVEPSVDQIFQEPNEMQRINFHHYVPHKRSVKSNRLALSAEMHGWYDALTVIIPVMNIPVVDNSFEIKVIVRALEPFSRKLISTRLKDGFVGLEDPMKMRTSVYVVDPKVFCECIEWKRKYIPKLWQSYVKMASAVE